jgi:biopolymer transport protein ExbB/TolQ
MWVLLIIAIIVAALAIKKVIDFYFKKSLEQKKMEWGLNAIIIWGVISATLGFLGHFQGMYLAMSFISEAADISPAIVAGGFAVSLLTILFGLTIFLFSAIIWLFLRWRFKQLAI